MPEYSSSPQVSDGGLYRSLTIQRRVVAALLAREILTRYGRHNIGFLWLFVEPMLFTVGITTLWTITKAVHGSNLPIVAFALTGYSSVLLWRNMPHRCIGAILPSLSLMFHKNVKVIDIFVSRLVLEMAGASVSFVVLSIFFISIGWLDPPEDLLEVLLGWGLLAWFGWAIAMLLGALSEQSEIVEKLWHPAAYLLFPLSGAAFMVDALPKAAQDLVLFIPMVHGVEMVREGYFGSRFIAHYNMYYLISVCSVLTLFAMAKVRAVSRNVVPE